MGNINIKSGSVTVTPTQNTRYILTAYDMWGRSAYRFIDISFPAVTATISADPTSVNPGDAVTLTWSTTNATGASIDNGVGSVGTSGSVVVHPTGSTTYTITATGPGATGTAHADVTVTGSALPDAWGYWKMDEASGTRVDASGNARSLTLTAGAVSGDSDGAHFTNYSNGLGCATRPNLNGQAYTYVFWTKPKYLLPRGGSIAAIEISTGFSDFGISILHNSGTSKWYVQAYTEYANLSTQNLVEFDDLTTHMITVRCDKTKLYIDIDNANAKQGNDAGFDYDTSGDNQAINGADPTTYAEGWIKDFGIWVGASALASVDLTWLYNSGSPRSPY